MKKMLFMLMVVSMGQTVQGNFITRLSRISGVLKYIQAAREFGKVWWFTDIDGTLIRMLPEPYKLMEKDTAKVFEEAQKEAKIVGLTATEQLYMYSVLTGMKDLDINFVSFFRDGDRMPLDPRVHPDRNIPLNTVLYNNVIFTKMPKGQALVDCLRWCEENDEELPETLIFTDDKEKNVQSVVDCVPKVFDDISIIGLHYVPSEQE